MIILPVRSTMEIKIYGHYGNFFRFSKKKISVHYDNFFPFPQFTYSDNPFKTVKALKDEKP